MQLHICATVAVAVIGNTSLLDFNIHFSLVLQKVVGNQSHINPIAQELSQRFIVDGYVIKDETDIIFLSRIIEGFSRNIASNDKVVLTSVYILL